jgi:hypothetical protein
MGTFTLSRDICEAGRSACDAEKGKIRLEGSSYPQRFHQVK